MNADTPAFPQPLVDNQSRIDSSNDYGLGGMTYRQWLIGQIAKGLVSNPALMDGMNDSVVKWTSTWSQKVADEIIAQI